MNSPEKAVNLFIFAEIRLKSSCPDDPSRKRPPHFPPRGVPRRPKSGARGVPSMLRTDAFRIARIIRASLILRPATRPRAEALR